MIDCRRVYYLPDGRVAVTTPAPHARHAVFKDSAGGVSIHEVAVGKQAGLTFVDWAETEQEWYERCCTQNNPLHDAGHQFDDIDKKDLPAKVVTVPDGNGGETVINLRRNWTGSKGQPMKLDDKIEAIYVAVDEAKRAQEIKA